MNDFKKFIYTLLLLAVVTINSATAVNNGQISDGAYLDLSPHLSSLLDQVHDSRLNTIVVMTAHRNNRWINVPYQLIIMRTPEGWLVTQDDNNEFAMKYTHSAQQSEWQIASSNIFTRCFSTRDNIDKPVVVFLNFSFHCDGLRFNSHDGKMLVQVSYPENHDVTGIYVSYNNIHYSSYFSFHDNSTYKSYSYQDDIHLRAYTNNLRKATSDDIEPMPIFIPLLQTFGATANNSNSVLIPFLVLESMRLSDDDEPTPIIIPSLEK